MESSLALKSFVDPGDGKITCRLGGSDQTVRLYPIDIREIHAKGTSIQFPPFTKALDSAPADDGAGGGDPEKLLPFDYDALELEPLKDLYLQALEAGIQMPEPKGSHGKPWYVKTLIESGYFPEVTQ